MSEARARRMCEAVSEALAPFLTWEPETGTEMAAMLAELAPVTEDLATAVRAVALRLEDGPFDKGVAASAGARAGQLAGLAAWAEQDAADFELAHERELERQRNPPPGAETWNVGRT